MAEKYTEREAYSAAAEAEEKASVKLKARADGFEKHAKITNAILEEGRAFFMKDYKSLRTNAEQKHLKTEMLKDDAHSEALETNRKLDYQHNLLKTKAELGIDGAQDQLAEFESTFPGYASPETIDTAKPGEETKKTESFEDRLKKTRINHPQPRNAPFIAKWLGRMGIFLGTWTALNATGFRDYINNKVDQVMGITQKNTEPNKSRTSIFDDFEKFQSEKRAAEQKNTGGPVDEAGKSDLFNGQ